MVIVGEELPSAAVREKTMTRTGLVGRLDARVSGTLCTGFQGHALTAILSLFPGREGRGTVHACRREEILSVSVSVCLSVSVSLVFNSPL